MFKIISVSFLQILLIVNTFALSHFDSAPGEFYLYLDSIQSALRYMKSNIEDVNLDAYFGVLLAKVHLENIDMKDMELEDTVNLAKQVLITRKNKVNLKNSSYLQNIEKYIMNEKKWKSIISKRKALKCNIKKEISYLNLDRIRLRKSLLSFDTAPNEMESDICLSEIIVTNKVHGKNKYCPSSKMCYDVMIIGQSKGYSKTHRLLYFIIGQIEGCFKCGGTKTNLAINNLCCGIMAEASAIEESGFALEFKDLFMEQLTLCAVIGYMEVLKPQWIASINDWQRLEGCWGHYYNRIRRSSTSLGPANCSSHSTGLGISTLAMAAVKMLD
ncbi:UPF0764 protein C16orf89 homolog [Arctopsyche grandis]|uniref:UPF0764 protein C16orf89 homolog n=1 Tax=Arctopsyche grandis TaxID=121162 RepID=UPI00406D8DC6